ncbi:polycystin family receptor for egg jelly-like [Ptychodera flava]|uniref:polycystin family receptor for egg jelly-like n=1 Tax=Ptychodera flava TaxID=63121 RepID=UPI00396A0D31
MNWFDARDYCLLRGKKLASIRDQDQKSISDFVIARGQPEVVSGSECYFEEDGADYRGVVSKAQDGEGCVMWTRNGFDHPYTTYDADEGIGNHKYCRKLNRTFPWCYTDVEISSWEYCDVGLPVQHCGFVNVATGKSAQMSSLHESYEASRAVDGDTNGSLDAGSCAHTAQAEAQTGVRHWWQVDLGETFAIRKVSVYHLANCCPFRIAGAEVSVGMSSTIAANELCGSLPDPFPGTMYTLDCGGIMHGRYVGVRSADFMVLHICEVFVWAVPADCPDPLPPVDGYIVTDVYNRHSDSYPSGAKVTLACNSDPSVVYEITCGDGSWEGTSPNCIESCNDPGELENGFQKNVSVSPPYQHGAKLQYDCNPGFQQGPFTLECMNGEWNLELPTCFADENPVVEIRCITNCAEKVKPSSQLSVMVDCSNCLVGYTMFYAWTLQRKMANDGNFIDMQQLALVTVNGVSSPGIILIEDSLMPGQEYRLTGEVTRAETGQVVLAIFSFVTNAPPMDGTCSMSPMKGYVLTTKFTLVCENWKDDGGVVDNNNFGTNSSASLIYEVRVRHNDSEVKGSVLYVSKEATGHLFLPAGSAKSDYRLEIVIDIVDMYGESTKVLLPLQVLPLNDSASFVTILEDISDEDGTFSTFVKENDTELAINYLTTMTGLLVANETSTNLAVQDQTNNTMKLQTALIDSVWQLTSSGHLENQPAAVLEQTTHIIKLATSSDDESPVMLSEETQEEAVASLTYIAHDLPDIVNSSNPATLGSIVEDMLTSSSNLMATSLTTLPMEKGEVDDVTKGVVEVIDSVLVTAVSLIPPSIGSLKYDTDEFKVDLSRNNVSSLCGKSFGDKRIAGFSIVDDCNERQYEKQAVVYSKFTVFRQNPYTHQGDEIFGDSPVIDFDLVDSEMTLVQSNRTYTYEISKSDSSDPESITEMQYQISPTTDVMVSFNISVPRSNAILTVKPGAPSVVYELYLGLNMTPNATFYDDKIAVDTSITNDVYIDVMEAGTYGILLVMAGKYHHEGGGMNDDELLAFPDGLSHNGTLSIEVTLCRYWNTTTHLWQTEGCKAEKGSNSGVLKCICRHLTSFTAADVIVPVNKIDFSTVFTKSILDNSTVLITVSVVFVVYLILILYLRRKDSSDKIKWRVMPLIDNDPEHHYWYQIIVYTGIQMNAGTDSVVHFKITGNEGETDARTLMDGNREIKLKSGSVLNFKMAVKNSIGQLDYIHIWHDQSASGDASSWYLDRIVVIDLQTEQRYDLLCYKWFAVDKDDGKVERVLPVAGSAQLSSIRNVLFNTGRDKLTDEYLWGSMISRPTYSHFTRVQRLSCCVAYVYNAMISNAMFYDTGGQAGTSGEGAIIVIGPIQLSLQTLYISFITCLVTLPATAIIVEVFRKCKPKPYREFKSVKDCSTDVKGKKKKKGDDKVPPLPWWCVFFAWALVFACIFLSSFFLVLYSLEWGPDISNAWLSAELTTFCLSVVVIDPAKAVGVAIVISVIYNLRKTPYIEEHDTNDKYDVEEEKSTSFTAFVGDILPPSEEKLESERRRLRRQREMRATLLDLVHGVLFMLVVTLVEGSYRDISFFYTGKAVRDALGNNIVESVKDQSEYLRWLDSEVIPSLVLTKYVNGGPLPRDGNVYMSDGVSRLISQIILRQKRIKTGQCQVPSPMDRVTTECNIAYSSESEDHNSYNNSWSLPSSPPSIPGNVSDVMSPWIHSSAHESIQAGTPFWGVTGTTFSDGGYIASLGEKRGEYSKTLNALDFLSWVDRRTRAVFLELLTYNANTRLLTLITHLTEFKASAFTVSTVRIQSLHLYSLGSLSATSVLAHIVFLIFVLFFVVKWTGKAYRSGCTYFRQFWNWWLLFTVIFSVTTIAMFAWMCQVSTKLTKQSLMSSGAFTEVRLMMFIDELFVTFLALISFMVIISVIRVLRFNPRIHLCQMSLRAALSDLRSFTFFFFFFFLAFAQLFYLFYGCIIESYKDFHSTISVLLGVMVSSPGNLTTSTLSDLTFPPHFLLAIYIFVQVWIFLMLLLAIINKACARTRDVERHNERRDELMMFCKESIESMVKSILSRCGKTNSRKYECVKYEQLCAELEETVARLEDYVNRQVYPEKHMHNKSSKCL